MPSLCTPPALISLQNPLKQSSNLWLPTLLIVHQFPGSNAENRSIPVRIRSSRSQTGDHGILARSSPTLAELKPEHAEKWQKRVEKKRRQALGGKIPTELKGKAKKNYDEAFNEYLDATVETENARADVLEQQARKKNSKKNSGRKRNAPKCASKQQRKRQSSMRTRGGKKLFEEQES